MPEIVREHGGEPVRTRVGHSFIKDEMARTDAVFGGEHSAHYYFRDFWRADTGMLAAMHVLAALGEQAAPAVRAHRRLQPVRRLRGDQLHRGRRRRPAWPRSATAFEEQDGVTVDELDGLTVELPDGAWFNLRASNTEPLLRLNVEAPDAARMAELSETGSWGWCAHDRDAERHAAGPLGLDPAAAGHPGLPGHPPQPADRRRAGRRAALHHLRPGLPGARRHPGAAARRGPAPGRGAPR